jgi:hypothetical protein
MDRLQRWGAGLVVCAFIIMVVARFTFGVKRYDYEPASTTTRVLFVMFSLIGIGLAYAIKQGLSFEASEAKRVNDPQREKEWEEIQTGYRIMRHKGLKHLQPGYQKLEDEYKARYGTTDRGN